MESVKESFVLNWSWFHLPQRTVRTWVTWLLLLHIPSWAYWVCMHMCVCTLRMGPFPWFHSSAVRMCLSEKEFGNVFLKQMRGKTEKKRERGNGSVSIFWWAQDGLYSMWRHFHTVDPEIPPACTCVCVYAEPQLSTTGLLDDSVQWGVHWSDSKWRREEKMV